MEQLLYNTHFETFSFILESLEGENAFVLSLDLKVCLDETLCYYDVTIFDRARCSQQLCDFSVLDSFTLPGNS